MCFTCIATAVRETPPRHSDSEVFLCPACTCLRFFSTSMLEALLPLLEAHRALPARCLHS